MKTEPYRVLVQRQIEQVQDGRMVLGWHDVAGFEAALPAEGETPETDEKQFGSVSHQLTNAARTAADQIQRRYGLAGIDNADNIPKH